jgi:hypothetical protein
MQIRRTSSGGHWAAPVLSRIARRFGLCATRASLSGTLPQLWKYHTARSRGSLLRKHLHNERPHSSERSRSEAVVYSPDMAAAKANLKFTIEVVLQKGNL